MSIGFHVDRNKAKTLEKSLVEYMKEYKSKCFQIFSHGPRNKTKTKLDDEIMKLICKKRRIYIHSTYLTTINSLEHLQEQLDYASLINSKGVVFHLEKKSPETIAKAIAKIKIPENVVLYLEMKAVKPDGFSYETAEKLKVLIDEIEKHTNYNEKNIGICIDTAHIYTGLVNISSYDDAKKYFKDIKKNDLSKYVQLLHLNGNKNQAGKIFKDEHTIPFKDNDHIWNNLDYEKSGCKVFVDWFQKNNKDIIIECQENEELKKLINNLLA